MRGGTVSKQPKKPRVSLEELERLIDGGDDDTIEILPDGTIKQKQRGRPHKKHVLTFREQLGGEYAA